MRHLWLFLLICLPLAAHAVIYVKEDADSISYSDSPLENGKKLDELPPVNELAATVQPTAPTPMKTTTSTATTPVATEVVENKSYNNFLIASPKDQETFQNQPTIPVDIKIEPSLQEGDRIILLLDDKPWGEPSDTNKLTLNNVERGFHILGAAIIDKNQKILKKSNVVTIYVHRSTLNNPTRQQNSSSNTRPTNLLRAITRLFSS